MWKFREKICPQCGIDLTGVEPGRIREDVPQPYSVCPNCGRRRPVADIEPETGVPPGPEVEPEAEAPETPEAEPTEPEAEPEPEPSESEVEEPPEAEE